MPDAAAPAPPPAVPSAGLLAPMAAELMRHAPFQQMAPAQVERFVGAAEQLYFAPGETVLTPAGGPVTHLLCIRRGAVSGQHGMAELSGGFLYEAGDLFPVGALLGARAVTATYTSQGDSFCLRVPLAAVQALAADSVPFADFLNRRVQQFLELSRRALQSAAASQALAQQSLATPLGTLARRAPLAVALHTPLAEALALMHEHRVGSVLVVDSAASAVVRGILTRHDILGRVTLPQVPLATAIEQVMTSPVHTLTVADTAQDAALLMSQHGMQHVPVTDDGRLVGIVSERDLFALQRLSIKHVGSALEAAADVPALRAAATDIRRFAAQLLAQGVHARQLTELVSHLNDRLTARLVALLAAQHGLDMGRACWLAFGSEGREEQTLATDQDNGLVFVSDDADAERPRWLAFGQAVNQALDDCGYPLCRGGIMAGQPACCLSPGEWRERFASWIEHGAPQDLLNAAIFFDLRPLAGRIALAAPLREFIVEQAAATPRFLRQMAQNALSRRAPLNWHGALAGDSIDLKLQGTGLFVEAARLLALAAGSAETSTRRRFEALAVPLHIPVSETAAWAAGFEHLQLLRLVAQSARPGEAGANRCDIGALNDIDQRVLRDTLRVLRRLQQRIELDYLR